MRHMMCGSGKVYTALGMPKQSLSIPPRSFSSTSLECGPSQPLVYFDEAITSTKGPNVPVKKRCGCNGAAGNEQTGLQSPVQVQTLKLSGLLSLTLELIEPGALDMRVHPKCAEYQKTRVFDIEGG